jgi:hypothetical protein
MLSTSTSLCCPTRRTVRRLQLGDPGHGPVRAGLVVELDADVDEDDDGHDDRLADVVQDEGDGGHGQKEEHHRGCEALPEELCEGGAACLDHLVGAVALAHLVDAAGVEPLVGLDLKGVEEVERAFGPPPSGGTFGASRFVCCLWALVMGASPSGGVYS